MCVAANCVLQQVLSCVPFVPLSCVLQVTVAANCVLQQVPWRVPFVRLKLCVAASCVCCSSLHVAASWMLQQGELKLQQCVCCSKDPYACRQSSLSCFSCFRVRMCCWLVGWRVHVWKFWFFHMNASRNEFVPVLACPTIADPQREIYILIKQSFFNPPKKNPRSCHVSLLDRWLSKIKNKKMDFFTLQNFEGSFVPIQRAIFQECRIKTCKFHLIVLCFRRPKAFESSQKSPQNSHFPFFP